MDTKSTPSNAYFIPTKSIFTYAKNFLEGKAKGPNAYEDGALINRIKKIPQLRPEDMKTLQECEIFVTAIASNHLKTKILWLSNHKAK